MVENMANVVEVVDILALVISCATLFFGIFRMKSKPKKEPDSIP